MNGSLDGTKIGLLLGKAHGAVQGALFPAVEKRIKVAILSVRRFSEQTRISRRLTR